MSFLSSILKHSSQSVAAGMIGAIGSFGASVIVARLLGVHGTATVAMALWIAFLTTTIADAGITGTLTRFVAERSRDAGAREARLLAAFALRAFLIAILAGLLLGAAFLWAYWNDIVEKYSEGQTEALVFCALVLTCFVVHMLHAFAYSFLRGQRAFKAITVFSLLGSCLQVAGVVIGSMVYGANGALAGYISASLPMLFGLRSVPLSGPIVPPTAIRRMRSYAGSFYLAVLFSPLLWVRADMLIVDQLLGARAVGLFAAAATVAALVLQVCQMICNALLPNIVHAASDDRAGFENASRTAARLSITLLIPACLIAAAAAPEAVRGIFGQEFADGGTAAAILCLAAVGSALTLIVASVLNADEANGALIRNGIIGALLTITSGIALVVAFGLVGAALGRLISQGIMGLLNVRSANRRVEHLVTAGWMVRIGLAATVGALVTEALGWWMPGGLPALMLSLIAGGVAYCLAAVILLPLADEERKRLLILLKDRPAMIRRPASWLLTVGRAE